MLAISFTGMLALGYYLFVYVPQLKQEQERVRELSLEVCLSGAEYLYSSGWQSECKSRKVKADCSLPSGVADAFEQNRRDRRAECYVRYPVVR